MRSGSRAPSPSRYSQRARRGGPRCRFSSSRTSPRLRSSRTARRASPSASRRRGAGAAGRSMTSTSIRSRANSRAGAPARADESLLLEARSRARTRLSGRERWTSLALGGGFLLAAAALPALLRWEEPFRPATAALLVLTLALVSRIEFEIGTGSVVPTQLVLVPMLLLLSAPMVPLSVAGGYLLG